MTYLEIINDGKLKIETEFEAIARTWKLDKQISGSNFVVSSYSFINEFQLVDITLSYYVPINPEQEEEGVDISISFFQNMIENNEYREYNSKIKYDNNGDLNLGETLYIVSSICITTGSYLYENEDCKIIINGVEIFKQDLNNCLDSIFISLRNQKDLVALKLNQIKKCS